MILDSPGVFSKMQIPGPHTRSGESEPLGWVVVICLCYQNVRLTILEQAQLKWKNYNLYFWEVFQRSLWPTSGLKDLKKISFFASISSVNHTQFSTQNVPLFFLPPFPPKSLLFQNTFDNCGQCLDNNFPRKVTVGKNLHLLDDFNGYRWQDAVQCHIFQVTNWGCTEYSRER